MAAEKVEVVRRPPPLLHIVTLILVTWAAFVWGFVTRVGAGGKYWVMTGTFLPWIYILLTGALIARKTGKKLDQVLDRVLFIAIIYALAVPTSKLFYFSGTSEVNLISNLAGTLAPSLSIGVWPPEAAVYIRDLIPSWLVVWDPVAADRFYRGGGGPIWDAMLPVASTWTLILLTLAIQALVLAFMFIGPELYETLRLPFPITIPTRFSILNSYTDPAGGLFFDMKRFRLFWAGVAIATILTVPYILSQLIPGVTWVGGGFGYLALSTLAPGFVSALSSALPNAVWIDGCISPLSIAIISLWPTGIITTAIFWRIVIGWIYPPIATLFGLIPAGAGPWWYGPIKLGAFNPFSSSLGLGLIALFLMRRRIKDALSMFTRGGEMGGVPVKFGLSLFIICFIIFFVIWSAAGLDPLSNLLLWILFTATSIGGAYFYAQLIWYGGHCTGYNLYKLVYPVSAQLGLLPWTPTPGHTNAAVFGYYVATMGSCVGIFESNCMVHHVHYTNVYSIGAGTGADLRRLFIYILTITVAVIPFACFFETWFMSHVGIGNTAHAGSDMAWWNPAAAAMDLGVRSITWARAGVPLHEEAAWNLGWALVIFACYFITARFPVLYYFINPLGMAVIAHENYWIGWIDYLLALLVKYLLTRIYGAKRAQEMIVEFVSGLGIGYGILFPILGIYVFITSSLPTIAALWR
ncbi:MAG: hypothetical protein QW320_09370 [Ignisphaera sp.]